MLRTPHQTCKTSNFDRSTLCEDTILRNRANLSKVQLLVAEQPVARLGFIECSSASGASSKTHLMLFLFYFHSNKYFFQLLFAHASSVSFSMGNDNMYTELRLSMCVCDGFSHLFIGSVVYFFLFLLPLLIFSSVLVQYFYLFCSVVSIRRDWLWLPS